MSSSLMPALAAATRAGAPGPGAAAHHGQSLLNPYALGSYSGAAVFHAGVYPRESLHDLWRSPATVFTGRVDGGPDPASLFSRRDAGLVPGADRFPRTGERRYRRDQPTDPRDRKSTR